VESVARVADALALSGTGLSPDVSTEPLQATCVKLPSPGSRGGYPSASVHGGLAWPSGSASPNFTVATS